MRKAKRGVAWLTMLIFLLVPGWVLARSSLLPYAPIDKRVPTVSMVKERYALMKAMKPDDPRRMEYYSLIFINAGFTEAELDTIIANEKFVIGVAGDLVLYTYALNTDPPGTSSLHRTVGRHEWVIFVPTNVQLIPLFLPECMNPLEGERVVTITTREKIECCVQGGPIPQESALIQGGTVFGHGPWWGGSTVVTGPPRFTYFFYPTTCNFAKPNTEGGK